MLPTVPSEGVVREGAAIATSVAPPIEDVRVEVEATTEPEQSAAVPVAPLVGVSQAQSSSSFPSLSNVGPPTGDQRKAPMTSVEDAASEGHMVHFDIRVPEDESVLANPNWPGGSSKLLFSQMIGRVEEIGWWSRCSCPFT